MMKIQPILAFFLTTFTIYAGCDYTPPTTEGAGGTTSGDSTSSSSSSGGPPMRSIACGATHCTDTMCCLDPMFADSSACALNGSSCKTPLQAECDGPEDCQADQVCCGMATIAMGPLTEIKCASSCEFPNRTMCNINNGTTACPAGGQCIDDPGIVEEGYYVCAPTGT